MYRHTSSPVVIVDEMVEWVCARGKGRLAVLFDFLLGEKLSRDFERLRLDEGRGILLITEKRFHFVTELFVILAGFLQKDLLLTLCAVECGMVEPLDK